MARPSGQPPGRHRKSLMARAKQVHFSLVRYPLNLESVLNLQRSWASRLLVRFALISSLTAVPWLPVLCQQTATPPSLPANLDPAFNDFEPATSSNYGSVYVPLDSWVYPAFERLFSLGYADSAYLGMRPWTRTSCLQILAGDLPQAAECSSGRGSMEYLSGAGIGIWSRRRADNTSGRGFECLYPEHVHQGPADQ